MSWAELAKYVGIFLSAAIEGEVVYVSALVFAQAGKLDPTGVLIAGALGGSAGDQFYFYALRTSLAGWLDRFPSIKYRRERISDKVQKNSSWMILMSRFLPGLRIAIPAACAYAGIGKLRFTVLSIVSGVAWAAALMGVIVYLGPKSLQELGLHAWWTPIIPATLVILFFRWLSRAEARD